MPNTEIDFVKPVINLNGDSPDNLRNEYFLVWEKSWDLLNAMYGACPHGRNYFNSDDYQKDRATWQGMVDNITRIRDSLIQTLDTIDEQIEQRQKR